MGNSGDIPVDPKGRLIVPVAFRRAMPPGMNTFVVTQGVDGCLEAFDPLGWDTVIQRLLELGGNRRQNRQYVRALVGSAIEAQLDRQGRILLPRTHRDIAQIVDRAMMVGMIDRIEIWNPERYLEAQKDVDLNAVAEDLDMF
ncbi:MAG: division/cell wall cluster transcriptional repressor MraZ [bacterium]|nr:division/cell wall cluster transcriptional repressor MraZ [bacterium]